MRLDRGGFLRAVIIGCLLVLIHSVESVLGCNLRIAGVTPNLMVVFIISFALLRGSKEATLIGIAAGLLNDISFGMHIGPTVISYALIGYICGKLNKNFYRENFAIPFLCTIVAVLFHAGMNVGAFILRGDLNFKYFLGAIIIPELIYTITICLIVYQLCYIINEKIEKSEKSRNIMF